MTNLRTAAQAALDALMRVCDEQTCHAMHHKRNEYHMAGDDCPAVKTLHAAKDALRAALAQPEPQGEPVGHVHREGRRADGKPWMAAYFKQDGTQDLPEGTPLYTAPPQPTPVRQPLTDEQIDAIWKDHVLPGFHDRQKFYSPIVYARAIERAHGIWGAQ